MELENLPCAGGASGIRTLDRETFERVWRRVMPADRPDCPFEVGAAAAAPPAALQPSVQPLMGAWSPETAPAPAQCPPPAAVPGVPAAMEVTVLDLPENDVPCLGAASAVYGSLLQDLIADEITDHKTYLYMSRRVTGSAARILSAVAADELRHAKRLSAAYFLISGVRFWPDRLPAAPMETYLGALRQRFIGEQKGERAYRAAAADTGDDCLRELYLEFAGDEHRHAAVIRGLLEAM